MRCDLEEDPAVIAMASKLEVDESQVVGWLHRFWSWANRQTTDGNARSVTESWIDRYVRAPGFSVALKEVGWLNIRTDGIGVPKFERYNGKSAKTRALTARRVESHRNASIVTSPLPEKRREEKREKEAHADPKIAWTPLSGWNGIADTDKSAWKSAYPACAIEQELARMNEWLLGNPAKARKKLWRSFITKWLGRSQERGGGTQSNGHKNGQHEKPYLRAEIGKPFTY